MSAKLLRLTNFIIVFGFLYTGCQTEPNWEDYRGGIHIVLQVESKGDSIKDIENTSKIRELIEARIEVIGIKNKIVKTRSGHEIVIQLPPCKNPDRIVNLLSASYFLEFRLVDDSYDVNAAVKGDVPPGKEILYSQKADPETGQLTKTPYLVEVKAPLTGEFIANARCDIDKFNNPYISITLDETGANLLEKITGQNIYKRLAIVLNNEVLSAPVIQERITGGHVRITGNFTLEEAKDLVIGLRAGASPAHTKLIEYRQLDRESWLGKN